MKRQTKTPQHKIEEAVKRYLAGEPVQSLAKEYKVSRPGFYNWIHDFREQVVTSARRAGMSPENLEKAAKTDLTIELNQLKHENQKLKERLFELFLDTGKL